MSSSLAIAGAQMALPEFLLETNGNIEIHKGQNGLANSKAELQHHRTSTCDVLPTTKPSMIRSKRATTNPHTDFSINPLLFDSSKDHTTNDTHRNSIEGEYLVDSSLYPSGSSRLLSNIDPSPLPPSGSSLLPTITDPSPLPPHHWNNFQSESRLQETVNNLLESSYATVSQMEGGNAMQTQIEAQQNILKRNHEILLRSLVTPGIISSGLQQGFLASDSDSMKPLGYLSSNVWTSPTKKARIGPEKPLETTSQGPTSETSSSETDPSGASKPTMLMAMKCDKEYLSEYQCLVRQQIEIFEATEEEVEMRDRGRNSAIAIGQVGIRCKYCARIPAACRPRGASYYTSTMNGLYQAAQKMTTDHFFTHCQLIPQSTKLSLLILKQDRKRASDGKRYWAEGARSLGIRETPRTGLRLVSRPSDGGKTPNQNGTK